MSSLRSRVYFEKSKILRAQDQHVQALQVIGRVLGICFKAFSKIATSQVTTFQVCNFPSGNLSKG